MVITLTNSAIKEVKRVIEEQNMVLEDTALRIGIRGGGCSGFEYSLQFEDVSAGKADDTNLTMDGVQVVVDPKALLYIEGTTIDFQEDLNKRGFAFNNPNATKTCGCNKSFSA